jgi:hypothetical protein
MEVVTLLDIWQAPYDRLVEVLTESGIRTYPDEADNFNLLREAVARIYEKKGLLDPEEALLLDNANFNKIMTTDQTFETKYRQLQVAKLETEMSTSLNFEKQVIRMIPTSNPTLYMLPLRALR